MSRLGLGFAADVIPRDPPPAPAPHRALRRLVRETTLAPDNFIFPLFVCPGKGVSARSPRCPGSFISPSTRSAREAEEVAKLGIPSVILFGLPEKKDEVGSEAWNDEGVVQRAIARDQEGGARS